MVLLLLAAAAAAAALFLESDVPEVMDDLLGVDLRFCVS